MVLYLFARTCRCEEGPRDASRDGSCDTGVTEAIIAELAHSINRDLLLTEASLGDSHESSKSNGFGDRHGDV